MNSINNNPMDLSNALCVTVGMLPLFLLVQLIQLFANGIVFNRTVFYDFVYSYFKCDPAKPVDAMKANLD